MRTNSPQMLKTSGIVGLVAAPVLMLAVLGMGAALLLTAPEHPLVLMFAPMVVVVLLITGLLAWQSIRLYRIGVTHALPDGGHRCMCGQCGSDSRPVGPPSPVAVAPVSTPTDKRVAGIVACAAGLALALASVAFAAFGPLFLIVTAFGVLSGLLLAGFGAWWLTSPRQPGEHQCHCRWCGAPGMPEGALR